MQPAKNHVYLWRGRIHYGFQRGIVNEAHGHYAASILYSLDAPLRLNYADGTMESQGVILAPHFKHQLVAPDMRLLGLLLDPDGVEFEFLGSRFGPAGLRALPAGVLQSLDLEIGDLFLGVHDCVAAGELFAHILAELTGKPESALPRPEDSRRRQVDPRIRTALDFLQDELPETIPVARLAEMAKLSSDRFMHLFKEQLGLPVRRYLLWLKLQRAARLLTDGSTLTEAAHSAGFSDSAHMSRFFKENFGIQPSFFLGPMARDTNLYFCGE